MVSPEKLYRYRGNIKNEEDFLRSGRLFVPTFQKLNDPYDGLINGVFENDLPKFKERLSAQLAVVRPTLTPPERSRHIDDMLKGKSVGDFQRILDEIGADDFRREWKVLSLAARCDSELLWAHYGGQHRGICYEFRLIADPIFKNLLPVKYASKPPLVSYPFFDGAIEEAVLTKSRSWEYESEWRIVFSDKHPQIQEISKGVVESIIFGLSIEAKNKENIKKWASVGPFRPKFYQSRLKKGQYTIEIVEE